MQRCITCGSVKPLTDYYRHPAMITGRLSKCKECQKQASRAARAARRDHYQEYDRQRGKVRVRRKSAPVVRTANVAVGNAIRDGRLIRQPCEVCGETKVEAHHTDYTQPLNVMWLCREHHMQRHRFDGPDYRLRNAPGP
jgi:hypothetical protein